MGPQAPPYSSFALSLLAACLSQGVRALYSEGSAFLSAGDVLFLEKFAFTFDPAGDVAGLLNISIWLQNSSEHDNIAVVLFDDEAESYSPVDPSWNTISCQQRVQRARDSTPVAWGWATRPAGENLRIRIRQKVRPRWWYVALAGCSPEGGMSSDVVHVAWRLRATNPPYGWAEEFSADRRFVPHIAALLIVACGSLMTLQAHVRSHHARAARQDSASGKGAHRFAQLLLLCLVLACAGAVLSLVHFMRFSVDGTGVQLAFLAAQVSALSSSFILASLLLLVSEGKCISHMMVASDVRRMLWLLGPFLVSCMVLELWAEHSGSHAYKTDSVYTTPCGWVLVGIDLVLLGLYAVNLARTLASEGCSEYVVFYRTWGVVYGLWFLALPVTALLARLVLAPYAWFMVALSVKKGTAVLVAASLVSGFWPSSQAHEHHSPLGKLGHAIATGKMESAPPRGGAIASLPELLTHRMQHLDDHQPKVMRALSV